MTPTNIMLSPSLMGLPTEVRCNIWQLYYTEVSRPVFGYPNKPPSSLDINLILTCRRICNEARPMLVDHMELGISTALPPAGQAGLKPPRFVRDRVREVCVYATPAFMWEKPEEAVESSMDPRRGKMEYTLHALMALHEYPRLSTLRIKQKIVVPLEHLDRLTCDYDSLSLEDRRYHWDQLEYVTVDWILEVIMDRPKGEGHWLRKIMTKRHVETETRDWNQDYQDVASSREIREGSRESTANSISEEERVLRQFKPIIEASFDLHDLGDDPAPQEALVIDTLRVVVDARERKIIERKVMSEDSIEPQATHLIL